MTYSGRVKGGVVVFKDPKCASRCS
jgi:hypothetical protein